MAKKKASIMIGFPVLPSKPGQDLEDRKRYSIRYGSEIKNHGTHKFNPETGDYQGSDEWLQQGRTGPQDIFAPGYEQEKLMARRYQEEGLNIPEKREDMFSDGIGGGY